MSKETKLIPELRFPEFAAVDGWGDIELGEIAEIVRGGSPRPIQDYLTTDDDGLNWLKIADVPSDAKYITGTKQRVVQEAIKSTREVNPGDLILSNSMSFGRPYILKIKTCIHDGWIAIRKISEKTFEDYLYYFISSESSQRYFHINAAGAAVKNLNAEIIKLLTIYLPKTKEEQQKIATCLSSLDELIAAHDEKLEVLKNHKKGLLQNLFPRKGQKVPNYRFPEFKKGGDWIFEPFDKVYFLLVTNSFSRAKLNYSDGIVKNIHYGDIHTKFSTLFDITKEEVPYVNQDISIDNIKEENYCRTGDIVFADASEDLNDIGKSIEIINLNNQKLIAGLHTLLARQIDNDLETGFGGYLFKAPDIRKQIKREAQGAKVLGISKSRLSKITLCYPEEKEEQKKIKTCILALDNLIIDEEKKIEQLRQHKKGLMQGLFPKIER